MTDTGNSRVQKFDTLGVYISQFGTNGAGDGQFDSPVGIAISSTGDIYVGDGNYGATSVSRIQIFNPNGTFKSKFGSEGALPGQFNDIEGITLSSTGNLYTADYNNSRVQGFPPNTTIPSLVFGPGQLTRPEGVVVNSAGKIYVSDFADGRVKLFNAIGAFESEVGNGPGAGNGQFDNPQGLDLSSANGGRLYVGDSGNHRVQVFDSTGTFQYKFGTNGANPENMTFPLGVKVEPTTGKIYVVDVAPAKSRVTVWFDPTEWTQAGTSKLKQLTLDQVLVLNNGFHLEVLSDGTILKGGSNLTLNPGGTFNTNLLLMDDGKLDDNANTTFSFPIQLSTNGGSINSRPGNVAVFTAPITDDPLNPPGPALLITGGGTVSLEQLAANTYSGGTSILGTIAPTTLLVQRNNQLGAAANAVTLDNGIFKVGSDVTSARTFNLNAGGGTIDTNGQVVTFSGLIQGAGLFTIRGGGLARLTNPVANTYSGGTFITGNALLNVQRNDQLGTGNVILDNGTLRTLVNFATNKTITLQGAGAISNTAPANQLTLSGLITGPGLLTLQGGGTTFLTNPGANTYTGGTILKSATLADPATTLVVDRDNQLGTGSFTFDHGILKPTGAFASARAFSLNIGGGTFDTNGQNVTLSGLITGSGPFTKDGLGELKITNANNSFGGGIVVNGGTLTGNALTLTTSTIQNNAALVFDQQNAGTFSGNILGRGFVKTGPGILTMTGNYAALTTPVSIQEGEVSFTQSAPNGIDLAPATILDFSPPAGGNLTYGGQISGAGSVEVEGLGKLTMTGNQTYTGSTSIKQGTLALNGTVRNSDVFVSPGATLMGNGTMRSLTLEGTIAPGNSIGTQTIVNDFIMSPTSTYVAEVSADGLSDLIAAGGQAQLNGTLDVTTCDCSRQQIKRKTYTILTAAQGIVGRFAQTISSTRIKYTLQYLPNAVQVLTAINQDFVDLLGSANTSNAARTGRYLDTFADTVSPTSDLGQIIQILDGMLLTGNLAGLTNALDQIQPSQYRETALLSFLSSELVEKNVQLQQQYLRETHHLEEELRKLSGVSSKRAASFYKLVNDTLSKGFNFARIQENRVGPKRTLLSFLAPHGAEGSGMPGSQRIRLGQSSVWFQSYGQIHEKDSSNGNVGVRSQTGGFSLGADHEIMPNTFVGLFGGLSTTPFKWKSGRGNGHMNSYYGGLYGTWMSQGGLYVDGQVIAGQDRYRSNRTINFAAINRSATESHYGNQLSVDTEIGYACDMPVMTVQPYVGASYMMVRENGYTESGANGLNFTIKPKTSQFARGAIGAQFYRTFVCGETLLRPALQLAFVRKQPIGSSPADLNGGFVNQPQTLTVLGDNKARNQFAPGVSLTTQFRNGAYLIANVSGQVFSGQNSGEALLKVGYDF